MDVEYSLNGIRFEWDRRKAVANLSKHGVSCESACQAFFDPFIRWIESEIVGGDERERLMGMTTDWELLVVAYVDRGKSIRLVSARPATRQEKQAYEDQ
jgi:uncharacterized DUF497 family protein